MPWRPLLTLCTKDKLVPTRTTPIATTVVFANPWAVPHLELQQARPSGETKDREIQDVRTAQALEEWRAANDGISDVIKTLNNEAKEFIEQITGDGWDDTGSDGTGSDDTGSDGTGSDDDSNNIAEFKKRLLFLRTILTELIRDRIDLDEASEVAIQKLMNGDASLDELQARAGDFLDALDNRRDEEEEAEEEEAEEEAEEEEAEEE